MLAEGAGILPARIWIDALAPQRALEVIEDQLLSLGPEATQDSRQRPEDQGGDPVNGGLDAVLGPKGPLG